MKVSGYIRKPKDINKEPGWVSQMDEYDGRFVTIDTKDLRKCNEEGLLLFGHPSPRHWSFDIKWLDQLSSKLDLI